MAIDLRGIIEFVKAAVEMWALYSWQLAIKCVHSHLNGEPGLSIYLVQNPIVLYVVFV